MKAVVYKGPHQVAVEDVAEPRIEATTDALIKITTSGICGSDLHMYDGRTGAQPGIIFGHEPMGIIEEVGSAVTLFKEGDRVVIPFNVACGFCFNCVRGMSQACLTMNPEQAGAAYGYVSMGPYKGGQAEKLRVPFADYNCLKLPGEAGDEWEDDFVLLSDVVPTGYHATVQAHVMPGSTVAVFGDGPIGLMAAQSALLKGAAEVYVVDNVQERLDKAEKIGAMPIDFSRGDPVEQIMQKRADNRWIVDSLRPGEEKMAGVMCGIDAVGYQARDWEHMPDEQSNRVLNDLIRVVNPTGHIGVIGVYLPMDPGAPDKAGQQGSLNLWFGKLWEKGISIETGQVPVKKYNVFLRDLIIAGRLKPSVIVTRRISFDEVQDAYAKFDNREIGHTKIVIKPTKAYI